jgi:nicotinate-nucleotide adenylyltransferase
MKSVGLFGGTFDPIHNGHLSLAIEMVEKRGLDEVWFCPARISPFKQGEKALDAEQRLAMVKIAIAKIPFFRAIEIEIRREGPSYTYDTVVELQKEPIQLALILGEDALNGFSRWHRVEDLVQRVPLLIGSRSGKVNPHALEGSPTVLKAISEGLTVTREMAISATEIRERLKSRQICDPLLPKEVLDYIEKHHLYL